MKLGAKPWRAAALACGLLALLACAPRSAPPKSASGDQVVATVNSAPIWASEVQTEAVAEGQIARGETLEPSSQTFRQVLDEVIDQKLLAAEAVRQHLDRDPEIQRRMTATRDRVLAGALTDRLVASAVAPDQVKKMYDETSTAAQQSEEYKLSQIVVATGIEAVAIRNALDKGGNFASIAQQRSIDPQTRFKGGQLGDFVSLNALPPEYANALRSADARIGDVIGPFQISSGYVLLKVSDRRQEAPMSLEEARPLIVRFLTYDQVKDLLENLRGKAKVQLSLPPPPGQVPATTVATPPQVSASITPSQPAVNPTPSSVRPGASSLSSKPAAR